MGNKNKEKGTACARLNLIHEKPTSSHWIHSIYVCMCAAKRLNTQRNNAQKSLHCGYNLQTKSYLLARSSRSRIFSFELHLWLYICSTLWHQTFLRSAEGKKNRAFRLVAYNVYKRRFVRSARPIHTMHIDTNEYSRKLSTNLLLALDACTYTVHTVTDGEISLSIFSLWVVDSQRKITGKTKHW